MMSLRLGMSFRMGRWFWLTAWLMLLGTPAGTAWALGSPSVPLSTLESRYTTPTSRFVDIDGVRMHYKDEGTGPVVVMLTGSPPISRAITVSFVSIFRWPG